MKIKNNRTENNREKKDRFRKPNIYVVGFPDKENGKDKIIKEIKQGKFLKFN